MKCSITGLNVKVLARAIHALAKIGDELHVEPLKEGLSFRSVNASRSAFASFTFAPCFFSHYKYEGETDSHPDSEDVKCKITMKSCLSVFRTSGCMDKNVECCEIRIGSSNEADNLIFELRFKHGIKKVHYLAIIECEALQAIYQIDNVPNMLSAPSKVLFDAVHNFQQSQDEITLSVNTEKVVLSNFVENAPDPTKVMRTELSLHSGEFDVYSITEDTSITFRLKDLRALLAFGESVNLPITVNFETRGRPVVFVIKTNLFEANFVLATLSSPTDTQSNSSQATSVASKTAAEPPPVRANGRSTARSKTPNITSASTSRSVSVRNTASRSTISLQRGNVQQNTENSLFNFQNDGSSACRPESSVSKRQKTSDSNSLRMFSFEDIDEQVLIDLPVDEDVIPTTPVLDARSRHIFRRCFESTFDPRNIPGYDDLLAEDSAEENDS